MPDGSHTAEFFHAHGMADALVDRQEQRSFLSRALGIFAAPQSGHQRRARSFRLTPDAEDIGPGAYAWVESEELGLAAELAASLARMSTLRTPILSAVIGEGGSGGALALAVADHVIMLEGTIYSVIAPEGAAATLYRDAGQTPEVSTKLKLAACDLKHLGVVDEIVPDPEEGAYTDPAAASAVLAGSIAMPLAQL